MFSVEGRLAKCVFTPKNGPVPERPVNGYVLEVPRLSLAAKAGIRESEAILAVNGVQVHNVVQLQRELKKLRGKTVSLRVVGARDRLVDVELK